MKEDQLIAYLNMLFNWFVRSISCDVRRFCMEILANMLDNETNVLYNSGSFLLASFIPYVESVFNDTIYQIEYNRTKKNTRNNLIE